MEWSEVSIFTSSLGIDFVCDMLSNLGITGAVIEDENDFFSFLEENKKYWDYVDDELIEEKKKEWWMFRLVKVQSAPEYTHKWKEDLHYD